MPCMMKEALLSPGCTLEVIMIALRTAMSSALELKLVTMTISQSSPAKVLQSTVFLILSLDSGVQIF